MTASSRPTDEPCGDAAGSIRRVESDDRRRALSVLLTGRLVTIVEVVDAFLELAERQQLSLEELWAVYRDDRPVAAILIVPGAGRTATCLVCPVFDRAMTAVVGGLVRTACHSQDKVNTRIIQALVEPGSRFETESLQAAGFEQVAQLQYMERSTADASRPQGFDQSMQLVTWTSEHRPLFAKAILDSYEATKDCPFLVGRRHIDDIIASHMATGVFCPELWFCLVSGEQPVAVMLLNLLPQRRAVELVYLGVGLPWRRRGVGRRLVEHGLLAAQQRRVSSMILAVDQSNTDAMALYQRLGFVSGARKSALIFTLT